MIHQQRTNLRFKKLDLPGRELTFFGFFRNQL